MIYTFGNTVLDEHRRALYRGTDWIMVEPKVFDVLLYLVKNRDRVVTRHELLEACWPNVYVSDGTLSRCVSRVRQAVDQTRSASHPIFTLHGKGYRFVDPVSISETREAEAGTETEAEAPTVRQSAAPEAEHRVISVVDCALDIHGGRTMADAETVYDAMQKFGKICCEVASRYGSTSCLPTCEGVELRFGEPNMMERAAESAVLVGFELIERAKELGMAARVGVASGRAIVNPMSDGAVQRSLVVEIDPLRPACLRAEAEPNQCVVDQNTMLLVESAFAPKPRGDAMVMDTSVPIFQLSPRSIHLLPRVDDMPFFGRTSELAFLEHCWRYAAGGLGQTVNVMGAMGIGKTRLVQELTGRVMLSAEGLMRLRCSPHHRATPFYPLAFLLHDLLGACGGDASLPPEARIKALLDHLELPEADYLPLLPQLLSTLRSVRKLKLFELGESDERDAVIEAMVSLILAVAHRQPAILWVDDIQWVDPATLAVIEGVRARSSRAKLLVILAGRPEGAPGHHETTGATTIVLHPFTQVETKRFLNSLSDGPALSPQVINWIAERSDGVPLFLREIMSLALATAGKPDTAAILSSLQWQLQSLLDEAGEAKKVAQWASLLGRNFAKTVLAGVSDSSDEELDAALAHLTAIGLLSEGGCGKDASYRFSHGLVRDFAYGSMLGRMRRERHRHIAETMISQFAHLAARDPEAVAQHFEASDMPERAAEYRQQAQRVVWARGTANLEQARCGSPAGAAVEKLTAIPAACAPRRRVA